MFGPCAIKGGTRRKGDAFDIQASGEWDLLCKERQKVGSETSNGRHFPPSLPALTVSEVPKDTLGFHDSSRRLRA